MKEKDYDEIFNIKTSEEQKVFLNSFHYHRYEPSPYVGLQQLFQTYHLKSTDRIVDFGCGKGRLAFFIHYLFSSSVVGIEMNEDFYHEAIENRNRYTKKTKRLTDNIHFYHCLAEDYPIHPLDNRFYFFNPFSIEIFMKVIDNIMLSVEMADREIELVLYYVAKDYIYYLENHDSFELKDEVRIQDLYKQNPNERFLIYRSVQYDYY